MTPITRCASAYRWRCHSCAEPRQVLIQQGLVAYRRPLYQVLALEAQERAESTRLQAHDDTVDITAVCQQIWEVLA